MMTPETREYRSFTFDQPTEMRAIGIPVVFNSPTIVDYGKNGEPIFEVIDQRAFDKTIMKNVPLVVDHAGKPCATMRNGSLKLDVRNDGLHMEADLSTTPAGRDLYEYLKSGAYNEMSFAFTIGEQVYDHNTRTTTIKSIDRLYDVSVVMWGAYPQTSVSARSLYDSEEKKRMMAEAIELEKRKKLDAINNRIDEVLNGKL